MMISLQVKQQLIISKVGSYVHMYIVTGRIWLIVWFDDEVDDFPKYSIQNWYNRKFNYWNYYPYPSSDISTTKVNHWRYTPFSRQYSEKYACLKN